MVADPGGNEFNGAVVGKGVGAGAPAGVSGIRGKAGVPAPGSVGAGATAPDAAEAVTG